MNTLKLVLFASVLFACSSSGSSSGGTSSGASTSGGEPAVDSGTVSMNGDAATDPVDSGTTGVKPVTPQVVSVVKMAGALHVTWKPNDTALSGLELWRKKDAAASAKVVGLPGTAKSFHDTEANVGTSMYCYHVITTKAGVVSDMSNEICGTP
jgi:hypothetical protein